MDPRPNTSWNSHSAGGLLIYSAAYLHSEILLTRSASLIAALIQLQSFCHLEIVRQGFQSKYS